MSKPPIFATLSFDDALAASKRDNKLLLVDATAEWCGPCQVMDRTTWSDAKLIEALQERAIVIQIDVDAEEEVAKSLAIRAMPTVIVFRDGQEIDRQTGLQKTAQLLEWLDRLAGGETSLQRLERQCASNPSDMQLRLRFARKLLEQGDPDAATREYAWMWRNMLTHQPSMVGVKHSFMLGYVGQLIESHPPAREVFVKLRDEDAPRKGQPLDGEHLHDWVSLNRLLRDGSNVLAWFDGLSREQLMTGALVVDPLKKVERRIQLLRHKPSGDEERAAEFEAFAAKSFRSEMAKLCRALAAAGRHDDVARVRAAALAEDGSEQMIAQLDEAIALGSA